MKSLFKIVDRIPNHANVSGYGSKYDEVAKELMKLPVGAKVELDKSLGKSSLSVITGIKNRLKRHKVTNIVTCTRKGRAYAEVLESVSDQA